MPLPPGRARAFEAAGKQGCACVAWSRKRRSGLISRQGVYDNLSRTEMQLRNMERKTGCVRRDLACRKAMKSVYEAARGFINRFHCLAAGKIPTYTSGLAFHIPKLHLCAAQIIIYALSADESRPALAAPRHASTALFSCRFKCPCPPRRQRHFHGNAGRAYNTLHFASQSRVPNGGVAPFGNPHKKRRYATPPRGAYRLFLLSSPPAVSVEQKSAWD